MEAVKHITSQFQAGQHLCEQAGLHNLRQAHRLLVAAACADQQQHRAHNTASIHLRSEATHRINPALKTWTQATDCACAIG